MVSVGSPVSSGPRAGTRRVIVRDELYTLYFKNGKNEGFSAKSIAAAIFMAKRILDLPVTVSEQRFRAAGGDYILQNATGNRIYPTTRH